jgi:hypothetical protein
MINDDRNALKTRLAELETAIAETEKRLPAHSAKPPVMHDLLALEDERDALLQQLEEIKHNDLEKTC